MRLVGDEIQKATIIVNSLGKMIFKDVSMSDLEMIKKSYAWLAQAVIDSRKAEQAPMIEPAKIKKKTKSKAKKKVKKAKKR